MGAILTISALCPSIKLTVRLRIIKVQFSSLLFSHTLTVDILSISNRAIFRKNCEFSY